MKTILWRIWKKWLRSPLGKEASEDTSGSTASSWHHPSRRGCWGPLSGTGTPCPATCTRKMGSTMVRNPHAGHRLLSSPCDTVSSQVPLPVSAGEFWPWKLKHCKSVTLQCPGKAQWAHSRDFECGFLQRSVDELRIVTSKGSQWKPREFKALSVWYCKYWTGTWLMFAARGCSCQCCLC